MAQLTYPSGIDKGVSGDLAMLESWNVGTRILAESQPKVSYGRAVETDAASGDSNVAIYQGGLLVGVALRDKAKSDLTDGHVGPTELPVIYSGYVWVEVDQDVTPDDTVFARQSAEVEVFTIDFDVDFVTGNTINGTVGGSAIAAVPFNTDQATTIQDLADAIALLTDIVASAVVTGQNQITVTGAVEGQDVSSDTDFTVTGGLTIPVDTENNVSGPSDGSELGIFRADDDDVGNGPNAVAVSRARYITSALAGEVALLQINLP